MGVFAQPFEKVDERGILPGLKAEASTLLLRPRGIEPPQTH